MRIVFCFLLSLLFGAGLCHGDPIVEVVGVGECVDCVELKIEPTHALEGLGVSIVCKTPQGKIFKTRGVGELDGEGNFRVSLPEELVEDGKLKEECYAQLQTASDKPCPAHNGLELNRLMLKNRSEDGQKHVFGLAGKLKFSPALCSSATFWHHFKHRNKRRHHFKCPPKSKISPPEHKKPDPPAVPVYKKPDPSPVPVYKKPNPPPVPVHKKPHPPPVPVHKKPHPPPVPVFKKPNPPPAPVYKKPDPPSVPVPVYKKPLPPPVPFHKKPFPKIPKMPLPPFHKSHPPFPTLPHIPRFHHHIHRFNHHHHHHHFGKFPPLTPPHSNQLIN